jgi:hypothetical protein
MERGQNFENVNTTKYNTGAMEIRLFCLQYFFVNM